MSEQLTLVDAPEHDLELAQWHTPPDLANQIVDKWGDLLDGQYVLEPSAGGGTLVQAALDACASWVHAVELSPEWCNHLAQRFKVGLHEITCGDFLRVPLGPRRFDVALMNPPYNGGQDTAHLVRAMECARVVVAIVRLAALSGVERHEKLWNRVELIRLAILTRRPKFSGTSGSAKHDFAVVAFKDGRNNWPRRLRQGGRRDWTAVETEWW